jgi:catechol 2,3-dioxygenase-like lactoylglutathione lyase family enzyme
MKRDARIYRNTLQAAPLAKAVAFYEKLLGAKGRAVGGGRVYFDCGGVILALLDPAGGGTKARPAPDVTYFAVRDLAKFHRRAKRLRCLDDCDVHGEPAGAMVVRPWGERSFYAVDPAGNPLCFVDDETLFLGAARGR